MNIQGIQVGSTIKVGRGTLEDSKPRPGAFLRILLILLRLLTNFIELLNSGLLRSFLNLRSYVLALLRKFTGELRKPAATAQHLNTVPPSGKATRALPLPAMIIKMQSFSRFVDEVQAFLAEAQIPNPKV